MLTDDQSYNAQALPRNRGNSKNTRDFFNMTPTQTRLLGFMREYLAANGLIPTYDEMCVAMGVASKSNITRLVKGLEQRGFISRIPGCARAIRINEPVKPSVAQALEAVLSGCPLSETTAAELRAILMSEGAA